MSRGFSPETKIQYIYREILHEAKPSAIFCDIERGNHPEWNIPHIPRAGQRPLAAPARGMCGIFHKGWFPSSISHGNVLNITRFLILTILYCVYYLMIQNTMLLPGTAICPKTWKMFPKTWKRYPKTWKRYPKTWKMCSKLEKCVQNLKKCVQNMKKCV